MPAYAADLAAVRAAAGRLTGYVHRTPVFTCSTIDERAGRSLFFKCENFQKVGAFKYRGACNAVLQLDEERARRGVVTHSSGNHAQALALAARQRGIPAHIVMPEGTPAVKLRAVADYGARVILCAPTLAARERTAADVAAQTGAVYVPPYDDPAIIAGQGTTALELFEQVADLDAILAPVGGGGLISGMSVVARSLHPRVRIFAAEPEGADDAARSVAAGRLIPQTAPATIADGLRTSLGELTWPILRDHVEAVITVSEESIIAAMRLMWERAKLLIEPSSAVAVAAVLAPSFPAASQVRRVGVVLSGGNVDFDYLPW
ncbi:MAG TPA: pyridoxal-phosphate dependent enzyme [Candidatus Limnocylindrales bacterium]|nr:pyridoxal-phosphate dependent enzyme [Candidatus Limnocylindrales bacterium]